MKLSFHWSDENGKLKYERNMEGEKGKAKQKLNSVRHISVAFNIYSIVFRSPFMQIRSNGKIGLAMRIHRKMGKLNTKNEQNKG